MSRRTFLANERLRQAGLRPPLSEEQRAEMSRRRRLGIEREGIQLGLEPARPEVLELDEASFGRIGPACRRLLKQDPRKAKFAWLWAHSNQKTGAVKECLLKAGWPDNRSTAMTGWRLRKDWAIKEAIQEINKDQTPWPLLLPLAVNAVLKICQYAQKASERLAAAALIFAACPVPDTAPEWGAGERSDAERIAHIRQMVNDFLMMEFEASHSVERTAAFAASVAAYLAARGVSLD